MTFEIIHTYTRAQAIADGELVAVDPGLAREAGFVIPVALTRAAWSDCVQWTSDDNRLQHTLQDETGRLWDVLFMARLAASRGGRQTTVRLVRVPRDGQSQHPQPVDLVMVCGPGDDAKPVITIMQPGEE